MLTLIDNGAKFSRRLGEQVPDSRYASAIEGPPPRHMHTLTEAICWTAGAALFGLFLYLCFRVPG